MKTVKEQIVNELNQLIDYMDKYADDANEKMRKIADPSSDRWYYQTGKFSGMCDAALKTIMTKYAIYELLEKLPD